MRSLKWDKDGLSFGDQILDPSVSIKREWAKKAR